MIEVTSEAFVRNLLLVLLVTLVGCAGREHKLDASYAPLDRITERPNVGIAETAVTTIGDTVYVVDLKKWLAENAPGSLTYHATLLHEQEHARRQFDRGLVRWLASYMTDSDFMWREEQRGWYLELRALRAGGANILVDVVADSLASYKTITGKDMVKFDAAKAWVQAVLAGQWAPPPD
jgi:hypothetical protein